MHKQPYTAESSENQATNTIYPSQQAVFISFEGIDGAGKSTHIDTLAQAFVDTGRHVVRTREPGGTPLAEKLRELTLHDGMDGATEALLMFAARRDHVRHVITPALEQGSVVLCDRFTDATFAYQGGGRNLDWAWLYALEQLALRYPHNRGDVAAKNESTISPDSRSIKSIETDTPIQPHLTLWFALPPARAAQRLAHVRVPDRFESEPGSFFQAVHNAYARRMAEAPDRFVCINADQPPAAVAAEVFTAVRNKGYL